MDELKKTSGISIMCHCFNNNSRITMMIVNYVIKALIFNLVQ